MSYRPLAGIRVLDISRLYPGALTTQKLADLGADVVKIEEPGRGDYLRTIPPLVDGKGILHLVLDRGKRSVELNLKQREGVDQLLRLVAVTDVLVESARPGRFAGMGIDFAALRERYPRLVVCSVSGFGQTGPMAPAPSHGMNMDALAGDLILSDWKGRKRFVVLGFSLGVELGAANAALGIAAAVFAAKNTGQGVWIDASCWDGAFEIQRLPVASFLAAGVSLDPRDPRPLYDVYETADNKLVLFCAIERKFLGLVLPRCGSTGPGRALERNRRRFRLGSSSPPGARGDLRRAQRRRMAEALCRVGHPRERRAHPRRGSPAPALQGPADGSPGRRRGDSHGGQPAPLARSRRATR